MELERCARLELSVELLMSLFGSLSMKNNIEIVRLSLHTAFLQLALLMQC